MTSSSIRAAAPAAWVVAFVGWLVLGDFSVQRWTVVFWVVTGLVAFTVGRRPWWQAPLDWAPFIVFFLVYDYTRGAASDARTSRRTGSCRPDVDRLARFGDVPTAWLQERLAAPVRRRAVVGADRCRVVYMSFFIVSDRARRRALDAVAVRSSYGS